jgi:hypothetical protein
MLVFVVDGIDCTVPSSGVFSAEGRMAGLDRQTTSFFLCLLAFSVFLSSCSFYSTVSLADAFLTRAD